MAKTWSDDDPKAGLMTRKRAVIVDAALKAFLDNGYAESSVNRIAADAGVSIKTLYRHFENKDELFSAVMEAACASDSETSGQPAWFVEPPEQAFPAAGRQLLRHMLSEEQLALYRVVTRDAHRFPELGERYRLEVVGRRNALFLAYLDRWLPSTGWLVADKTGAAELFGGLMTVGIFEAALHGWHVPNDEEIAHRAKVASARILSMLASGLL